MFTGIISEIGSVTTVQSLGGGIRLSVEAPETVMDMKNGESVSVNGACQTVVAVTGSIFSVETIEETLSKTTLGELRVGNHVNLERALKLGDRMGGHMVQGHVDGVGTIESIRPEATSVLYDIRVPDHLSRYVVPIGSIALDGISLTVAALQGDLVTVAIIPHTLEHTVLGERRKGSRINVECDLIGKYIERLMTVGPEKGAAAITPSRLREWGYGA